MNNKICREKSGEADYEWEKGSPLFRNTVKIQSIVLYINNWPVTISSYLKSTDMWKNKLSRTNTTNRRILILRIVRTYENIIKEFFMCISINQVSHEKGWERDGSSETPERMVLVWQSDSDKFRLRYRTTEPYLLSLEQKKMVQSVGR